jgi:hypothetical protein
MKVVAIPGSNAALFHSDIEICLTFRHYRACTKGQPTAHHQPPEQRMPFDVHTSSLPSAMYGLLTSILDLKIEDDTAE